MKSRLGASLFAGASVLVLAAGAHAQSASTSDEIVVTGSRTLKNGNASPTPLTVVQAQDLLNTKPGLLTDALIQLPTLAFSKTTAAAVTVSGSVVGGNSDSNQLNLRSLGVTRTLTLLDGNRLVPTTYNGGVDVDIVPQELVQRVDVVTGGVSAVYGSDAVAGVVNYVLDHHFNGLKLDANAGESQRSDDRKYNIAIAGGTDLFGGRGHIEVSYEYIDEGGIQTKSDRSYLDQWGVSGTGTQANPYILQQDLRFATMPAGGLITNGALKGQTFAANGVLSPFVSGVATGSTALQVGGGGGYYDPSLITPEQANQFFGRFDYDLVNDIHFYAQVSGDIKSQVGYADSLKLSNNTFSSTNAFLTPAQQAALSGASTFTLSALEGNFSRYEAEPKTNELIASGGFNGTLNNYRWDVNFSHGQVTLNTPIENNMNYQHLSAALDAVVNPATGQVVCNVTLTNPSADPGCLPLNVFGPTAANTAALNSYVLQPTTFTVNTAMDDVAGHIAGSPFSAPAGPVDVAASFEWRNLSANQSTSAVATQLANCTGLRYNCTATTPEWYIGFANQATVSQQVTEGALEVNLPVVKDLPFIQAFTLNGAIRYTDYSTSGNYLTWKIGMDWHVDDSLRFRATRSRDIRAPTLYELFSPPAPIPVTTADLLTGQSLPGFSADITNPNLKAEIADTTTAGFVYQPKWAPGLSFSVDAYEVIINNAITDINGGGAYYQNQCYASGGTSIYCSLQSRPLGNFTNTTPANSSIVWNNLELNLAKLETEGADFEANYATRLFDTPASFRVLASYQPHIFLVQTGAATIDQGGVAFGGTGQPADSVWRLTGFVHFQPIDPLSIDFVQTYRAPMRLQAVQPGIYWVNNQVAAFYETNATLGYNLHATPLGQTLLTFNVNNLFDMNAPGAAGPGNAGRLALRDGFVPGDDIVGRAFMFGIRIRR